MNKKTELEKADKKKEIYYSIKKIAKITTMSLTIPVFIYMVKEHTIDRTLENQLAEISKNTIQIERIIPQVEDLYKNNDAKKAIAINIIDDLVQKNKSEIKAIKDNPLYLLEQNNLKKFNNDYSFVKLLFGFSLFGIVASTLKYDKWHEKFNQLEDTEIKKLETNMEKYVDENEKFSINQICETLKEWKTEPRYSTQNVVKNKLSGFITRGKINYDEEKEIYYSKSA